MAESAKKDARALSKLATYAKGKTVLRATHWPSRAGDGLPLQLRVLSCSEVQDVHSHAIARFQYINVPIDNVVTVSLFEDEVMTQLLHLACRDAENAETPFAESTDDLRDHTTPDERAAMYDQYRDLQQEVDPAPIDLGTELFNEIMAALKKKDAVTLRRFGSLALSNFMLCMDAQQSNSPTGS